MEFRRENFRRLHACCYLLCRPSFQTISEKTFAQTETATKIRESLLPESFLLYGYYMYTEREEKSLYT